MRNWLLDIINYRFIDQWKNGASGERREGSIGAFIRTEEWS